MATETLNEVPLPKDMKSFQYASYNLSRIKDNLCFEAEYRSDDGSGRVRYRVVWELKRYGEWGSWKKIVELCAKQDSFEIRDIHDLDAFGSNIYKESYLFLMYMLQSTVLCNCSGYSNNSQLVKLGCIPSERKALLQFRDSVTFLNKHVSSTWQGEDCCSWRRVKCNPTTGHVVKLHLHGTLSEDDYGRYYSEYLFEAIKMESSLIHLVELNHLNHLDVSFNDFNNSKIPKFLGYMKQLRYLNLSQSFLYGKVPHELGNLTNLQVLDLSSNDLFVQNLKWASRFEQLRLLVLSDVNLTQAHDWISSLIGPHPFLTSLGLSGCSLPNTHQIHIPPSIQNLTSLEHLDLSYNNFGSKIPLWLGELKSLVGLNLGYNAFTGIEGGDIWSLARNLCNLKYLDVRFNKLQVKLLEFRENIPSICTHFNLESLDLSYNSFISGIIPTWLGEEFQSLKYLDLGYNNISGKIPTSLGMLSSLKHLDISYNSLEAAVLSETYFANLSSLKYLDMSQLQTFLTMKLPSDWVPPFQLEYFYAFTCKFNSQLPQWLKTQKNLIELDLSNAGIQGVLPKWFHNMQSLSAVYLFNNNITGCPVFPINFSDLDLSNNSLSCQSMTDAIHRNKVYYQARYIDLSHNSISGKLPEHLYHIMPNLSLLYLSNNFINGSIPKSICDFTLLEVLDLTTNKLFGTIPGCLGNLSSLYLSFNKLSGDIPCFSPELSFLQLNDNILSGEIPTCLTNHSNLSELNVGENNLSGEMPAINIPNLIILRLRNNKLKGSIPHQLCSLSNLQILDLGHNYFTGTIPNCLSNLTAMNSKLINPSPYFDHIDNINEVLHGIEREYASSLKFLVNIDLSCNKLVGNIPDGITNLTYLLGLNISYNQLSGQIPSNIGGLKSLISLDLSRNKLSGSIPTSLGAITSLETLDLSYNNLSGQIPTGDQLQTFNNASIYAHNPYLCGEPLPKKCRRNDDSPNNGSGGEDEDNEDGRETMWFYLVVMSGFATGFWGVVGSLFLKKSWRHAFFRLVEDVHDWLYVAIAHSDIDLLPTLFFTAISCKYSDCVGALDGTHINAVVSNDDGVVYRGRSGKETWNVLAACSFDRLFTFINVEFEGSAHDIIVWNHCLTVPEFRFPHPPPGII
ncbi:receptor-like protein 12 [Chenopodium quinoa]|uniref:receptor-like protein 12 n=1 Tax=Chenopodium quinoa TaxID=63459 RepID=UPI000B794709|nr:receptor-like protein 12 [Chenopodium quinoa]